MGLVGCGAIGKALAKALGRPPLSQQARLIAVCDQRYEKATALVRQLRPRPKVLSMEDLVLQSELIVEAASPSVVRSLLRKAVSYRRDLLVMSTAGLLGSIALLRRAQRRGCHVTIPSGALIGVDGLKAFATGSVRRVTLTTRKPPRSFGLKSLRKPKLLFEGPAAKAVRLFPQNVNVAATVILAGISPKKFHVKIIADPRLSRNTHELSGEGRDGRFWCRTENLPSENPRTSRLAILSATSALRQMFQTTRVGT